MAASSITPEAYRTGHHMSRYFMAVPKGAAGQEPDAGGGESDHGRRRQRQAPERDLAQSIPLPAPPHRRRPPAHPIAADDRQHYVHDAQVVSGVLRNEEADRDEEDRREAVERLLREGPHVVPRLAHDRVEVEGEGDEQEADEAGRGW